MNKAPADPIYYQQLWGRAQILGLLERDPDQVNIFLLRWIRLLRSGETLPVEESKVLAEMLEETQKKGGDARQIFRPRRSGRKRARELGNDDSLRDKFFSRRAAGESYEQAIVGLGKKEFASASTIRDRIARGKEMDRENAARMMRLAAKDAIHAFLRKKFTNLEQACNDYARRCGLDSYRIFSHAEILYSKQFK